MNDDCDHEWVIQEDFEGDDSIPNGVRERNFLLCRLCGEEDYETDWRNYVNQDND